MNREILIDQAMELLDEYHYSPDTRAVNKIIDKWLERKANLLEHFRKSPYWNEDRLAIIVPAVELVRPFSRKAMVDYSGYLRNRAYEWQQYEERHSDGRYLSNIEEEKHNYTTLLKLFSSPMTVAHFNTSEMQIECAAMIQECESIMREYYKDAGGRYIPKLKYNKYRELMNIASAVEWLNEGDNIVSEDLKRKLSENYNYDSVVGQKTSRVFRALCEKAGVFEDDRKNPRGKLICEQKWADFADGLNPMTYKKDIVISLNPIDYWTMSFGKHWASCHTIDKENERGELNGNSTYEGCYSGGTESYMLDESTVILYYGEPEEKVKRCNFHISRNGNLICQGRVYPDARDDEDISLAPQFRAVVQEVVSDCWGLENKWTFKKGTDSCRNYVSQHQPNVNYMDFFSYSDCNMSVNKENFEDGTIYVGSDIICPSCGRVHTLQEWILCENCADVEPYAWCYRCDSRIEEYDDYIRATDDNYFCCEDCARRSGYHLLADTDDWSDEGYYDEYAEEYYSDYEVLTRDGHYYWTESNAEADGYVRAEDDNRWYYSDDVYEHSDGLWYTYEETEEEEMGS